jgi:GNAT superfamily N-acetyltransferase
MTYVITIDPPNLDIGVIHHLLAETYWSPRIRRDIVANAFQNSIVAVATTDAEDEIAGFARVVTDQATFAWLCDVYIVETHRGKGLARRLLTALEEDPRLQTVRRWCLATRDAHGLYSKLGYAPVPATAWMEKKSDPSAWQDSDAGNERARG